MATTSSNWEGSAKPAHDKQKTVKFLRPHWDTIFTYVGMIGLLSPRGDVQLDV